MESISKEEYELYKRRFVVKIKAFREGKGFTQKDIAEFLAERWKGKSVQNIQYYISQLERGERLRLLRGHYDSTGQYIGVNFTVEQRMISDYLQAMGANIGQIGEIVEEIHNIQAEFEFKTTLEDFLKPQLKHIKRSRKAKKKGVNRWYNQFKDKIEDIYAKNPLLLEPVEEKINEIYEDLRKC